jgi:hypothetical protein
VAEWNEDIINSLSGTRAIRGGGWSGLTTPLKASSVGQLDPSSVNNARGFRLVLLTVPEPDAAALGIAALASLGLLVCLQGRSSHA